MNMTGEEASSILDGFLRARSPLECFVDFGVMNCVLHGRIISLSKTEVTIGSDDPGSFLVLRLDWEGTVFGYAQSDDIPDSLRDIVSESSLRLSHLTISLPPTVLASDLKKSELKSRVGRIVFIEKE